MQSRCPICRARWRSGLLPPSIRPLPGDVGVMLCCRGPCYFGPEGWRAATQVEIDALSVGARLALERVIRGGHRGAA